jgi:hypothetical protein
MSGVSVVVTDLDGTLWWGREVAHPTTMPAWAELERRGIPVVVATGRRLSSARTGLRALGVQPPSVVLNGALVVDFETDERLHRRHYREDDAAQVLEAFREQHLEPCAYVDHPEIEVVVGPAPSTHPEHLVSYGSTAAPGDLDEAVRTLPVFSFGMMGHDAQRLSQGGAHADRRRGVASRPGLLRWPQFSRSRRSDCRSGTAWSRAASLGGSITSGCSRSGTAPTTGSC